MNAILYKDTAELAAKFNGWVNTYNKIGIHGFKSSRSRCHVEIHPNSKKILVCTAEGGDIIIYEINNAGLYTLRSFFNEH